MKLIIELDGTQHRNTVMQDAMRDDYLISIGYRVLRITHREYVKQTRIDEVKRLLNMVSQEEVESPTPGVEILCSSPIELLRV